MLLNNSVHNRRHLGHVVRVPASAHQEFQGSREVLDPRDLPEIMDLKDLRAQEVTKGTKDLVETRDLKEIQGPRVRRVCQEAKDALDPRDHPVNKDVKEQGDKQETKGTKDLVDPRDQWDQGVQQGERVNQVLVVSKVLRELLVLQVPCKITGNSAFLRI